MILCPRKWYDDSKGFTGINIVSTIAFSPDGRKEVSDSCAWHYQSSASKDYVSEPKSIHTAHPAKEAVVLTKLTCSTDTLETQSGNN